MLAAPEAGQGRKGGTVQPHPMTLQVCDRLVRAAREFIDHTELLQQQPEFRDSWAEMLLRCQIASPEFQQMRHAVKDYEAGRGF